MAGRAEALHRQIQAGGPRGIVLGEDVTALAESWLLVIRPRGGGTWAAPVPCEACGTPLRLVDEAGITTPPAERRWTPWLWEATRGGYRHGPRRCAWMREHGHLWPGPS